LSTYLALPKPRIGINTTGKSISPIAKLPGFPKTLASSTYTIIAITILTIGIKNKNIHHQSFLTNI